MSSKTVPRKTIIRIDDPCLCGSGKQLAVCHLDFDNRIRKKIPTLKPPGSKTGHSHPNCYLSGSQDCSHQISREHYMSKSVLDQLGKTLRVSGMPWMGAGQTLDITVGNLTSKILCKRHNEALSPLDEEAALFFLSLSKALADLERKTLSRKPSFHLVGGSTLELWMLKVACGLYFAIGTKDRKRISEDYSIDLNKVERAFFEEDWDPRGGLYFKGSTGSVVTVASDVSMAPLTSDVDMRFGGATVSLLGITLELLFDTTNTNPDPWMGVVRRPTELVFMKNGRQHSIILTWPPGTPEASISMGAGVPNLTTN